MSYFQIVVAAQFSKFDHVEIFPILCKILLSVGYFLL